MVLRDRFFASPPRPPKLGKQGGSSRKRNIAGGGPLAAWIGPVIHRFPATRQAAMTARLCSDGCHRRPHTCFPEPRTGARFASLSVSPAPVVPLSRSSSLRPPAGKAHRQHKPQRVRQPNETMCGVEGRGSFVQCIDENHRRAHGVCTLEGTLQSVRQED